MRVVIQVGWFDNRNDDDYRKAADAVRAGTATKEQKEMNDRAAKQAGAFGNRARDAMK